MVDESIKGKEGCQPEVRLVIDGLDDTVNAMKGMGSLAGLLSDSANVVNLLLCIGGHLQTCLEGIQAELEEYVGH